jgi:hypothetical protein
VIRSQSGRNLTVTQFRALSVRNFPQAITTQCLTNKQVTRIKSKLQMIPKLAEPREKENGIFTRARNEMPPRKNPVKKKRLRWKTVSRFVPWRVWTLVHPSESPISPEPGQRGY